MSLRLGPNPAPSIDVVFEFLSDSASDDVFDIVFTGSGFYVMQGTLRTVAASTVSAVSARSRGTIVGSTLAVGHPWQLTAAGPSDFWTSLVGDLVHDTTVDAWAWVHADLGTAQAAWSEPLSELAPDFAEPSPPVYRTPAPGDALTIATMPTITVARLGGLGESTPIVYHLGLAGPNGPNGFGSVASAGDFVYLLESRTTGSMVWGGSTTIVAEVNSSDDAVFGGTPFGTVANLLGGDVRDRSSEIELANASSLDGDVIVEPRIHIAQNAMLFLGRACIANQIDADRTSPNILYMSGQLSYRDSFVWTTGGSIFLSRGSKLFVQSNSTPFLDMTTHFLIPAQIDNNQFLYPWNVRNSGAYGAGVRINGAFGTGIVSTQVDAVAQDAGVSGSNGLCLKGDLESSICYQ